MQEEVHDQGLLVPWTDSTPSSYGELPLNDQAPDLLTATSPSQSPAQLHHQQQHQQRQHQQQKQHYQHLQQHQLHPQQVHPQSQHLVTLHSTTYLSAPLTSYNTVQQEAEAGSHFEYGSEAGEGLIPHVPLEMRTGPGGGGGGGGRVNEEVGKRGWKRRRESKDNSSVRQQSKLDVSQRCDVCGEQASGHYFGALVCLPCKSFFIRCTKDGHPNFSSQCGGKCDVFKGGRVRCQHCRFQKCISAGMYRKEKPEAVEPAEGQLLCKVCGDIANGVHFGVTTCEGCKKFFRRGLKENRSYTCKSDMQCSVNPRMRNNCRYCRYQKCLYEGMSREAIKMGRPKKGELSYRKPAKKNGVRPTVKPYDRHAVELSNRSSMSSEFDQDEVSSSGDVFEHSSSQQHQIHQQLNNQLYQQQPQQQQQQPHPQQPQQGGFSLGSILHDCMTVQDWDQKVELSELEQESHRPPSHSVVMSAASGSGLTVPGAMAEDRRQVSPHMRLDSPAITSDLVGLRHQQQQRFGRQIQVQQHHLQQHEQQQHHHSMMSLQDQHSQNVENMNGLVGMNYSDEQNLPLNRAIKVEDVGFNDSSAFTNNALLEDLQNAQTGGKHDFRTYQLPYTLAEHRTSSAAISRHTGMPLSQEQGSLSSQLGVTRMSTQNVSYTPQGHEPNPAHGMKQPDQNLHLMQQHQQHQEQHLGMEQALRPSVHADGDLLQRHSLQVMNPKQDLETVTGHDLDSNCQLGRLLTSTSRGHNLSGTSQNVVVSDINRGFPQENTYIANSINTSSPHRGSPLVNTSPRVCTFPVPEEHKFTLLSTSSQHTSTNSFTTCSPTTSEALHTAYQKLSRKSPIAAILQHHREAIQSGRPVQLSSEEIEELLNTVHAEQARAQQVLTPKGQRGSTESIVVDLRRQQIGSFVVGNDQQQLQQNGDERVQYMRETLPSTVRHYQGSPSSQLCGSNSPSGRSPVSQSMPPRSVSRQFQERASPACDSSTSNRQELCRDYPNSNMNNNNSINSNNNNNNNNSNSNNNNQINNYISMQYNYDDPSGQSSDQEVTCDDSFNSSLVRDSTVLHEINRIFLAIDNSCDTYGCDRRDKEIKRIENDSTIVSSMIPDDFSPELSHRYWHSFRPFDQVVTMTSDRQKIIQDVLDAFDNLQKTYMTNEPEYLSRKPSNDQLENWHHIQRRIARHVVAGQRFCRNIPGYFKLQIQDRISLGKHVGFGLMVLIACTEFYDPELKRFRFIWNWTMPMQNPLFSYKVHLLSLGDRIHELCVDRTEAAMLCAISMTSIDCPGLVKADIVCVVRDALIDALAAHIAAKCEPPIRLKHLLGLMPQVRLMTIWYNNLMKKMALPADIISTKMNRGNDAQGSENTPSLD